MSDRALAALESFLGGAAQLADVEAAVRDAVARNPLAAAPVLGRLDELLRSGRLPPQVHGMLAGAAGRAPPAAVDADAATRPQVASEPTRLDPARGSAPAPSSEPTRDAWGRTSLDTGAAPATVVQDTGAATVAADVSEQGAAPTVAADGSAPSAASRAPTGSNWEHPEEWRSRHDAIVGPGAVVGKFLIQDEIGRGGMGVVYRAIDLLKQEAEDRDPYVAVKILNDEFRRHPKALVALQREASKAQRLAHPNIITVHDFGRDGTTIYMTMELLKGEPLSHLIAAHRERGVAKEKALPLIHGMGEALAYAHKKPIAHCDFKPGNVFVKDDGDVKVLDFGIARAVPTALQPNADQTVFDAAELGALTPPYASPEMLNGSPATPADDVFALGIVAFELLTGKHPFDRTPANELPPNLKPKMPAGLSRRQRRALTRALDFKRESRHPNARAFLTDFEGPGKVAIAAYSIAAVSLVIAGYAVWNSMQLRPDVPFEDLPIAQQQRFNDAIEEGRKGLEMGDIGLPDALEYYSQAYDTHRNNPRAIQGLAAVADRYLTGMRETDADNQEAVLSKLYCQEFLSRYPPVLAACRSVLGTDCSPARLACVGAGRAGSN